MKKKMTFREFLALLPLNGWVLRNGQIERQDTCSCPWLYVTRLSNVRSNGHAPKSLWAAADNAPGHSPTLRARLLQACGLTPDGKQLYDARPNRGA